jgi:hypothetical protein
MTHEFWKLLRSSGLSPSVADTHLWVALFLGQYLSWDNSRDNSDEIEREKAAELAKNDNLLLSPVYRAHDPGVRSIGSLYFEFLVFLPVA